MFTVYIKCSTDEWRTKKARERERGEEKQAAHIRKCKQKRIKCKRSHFRFMKTKICCIFNMLGFVYNFLFNKFFNLFDSVWFCKKSAKYFSGVSAPISMKTKTKKKTNKVLQITATRIEKKYQNNTFSYTSYAFCDSSKWIL